MCRVVWGCVKGGEGVELLDMEFCDNEFFVCVKLFFIVLILSVS